MDLLGEFRGSHDDAQKAGIPLLWGYSASGREILGGPKSTFQCLKGPVRRERFLTMAQGDRTRGNGFKVTLGRFRLDIRNSFTLRMKALVQAAQRR